METKDNTRRLQPRFIEEPASSEVTDSKMPPTPKVSVHRGHPVFDRFFSQILQAVNAEDGAAAYDAFVQALDKAAEGKGAKLRY